MCTCAPVLPPHKPAPPSPQGAAAAASPARSPGGGGGQAAGSPAAAAPPEAVVIRNMHDLAFGGAWVQLAVTRLSQRLNAPEKQAVRVFADDAIGRDLHRKALVMNSSGSK